MPSSIDLCNRALSELGTRSTVASFDEGSAESIQAAMWYDPVRKMLLRAANWGFASANLPLSTLGSFRLGTSPYPWPFKYTYPADALKIRYLLPPQPVDASGSPSIFQSYCAPSRRNRFIISNDKDPLGNQRKVLLATLCDAFAVYTIDVQDVSIFDELFEQALVSGLAAKMCLSLTGNKDMRASFISSANDAVTTARLADGNEAVPTTDHTPDWIETRGVPENAYGIMPFSQGQWFVGYDNLNWGM